MRATAFIIGPQDGSGAGVLDLCLGMGFRHVMQFSAIDQAEQQVKNTPICFFVFTADVGTAQLSSVSKAVRFSRNRQVRYAPMVCFAENPGRRIVATCIQTGFDDVLVPPFSVKRVGARLEAMLQNPVMFCETPHYFGPDRRGRMDPRELTRSERGKAGEHRRIEFIRDVENGITILRSDSFPATRYQAPERVGRPPDLRLSA